MLGTLVVLYLFLGGCGAGVMFVTAAWSLAFHRTRTRTQEQTAAFGDLKARCYGIGFVMLCLAALRLLLDLGRPELAFLLFTRPTLSILSFGSFTLLASILVSGFLAVANLMYVPFVRAGARKAAEAACLAVSLCMMAYTGVYVGWIEAVALWNNAATPALFALSSLSAGVSTVFVIAPFVRDVTRLSGWMLLLHRVHLAVLVLELVMLAGFEPYQVAAQLDDGAADGFYFMATFERYNLRGRFAKNGVSSRLQSMPEMFAAFGMSVQATTLIDFMLNYLYGFLLTIFLIVANKLMVRYLDRGAMAYLLATPNSRTRIALTMVGVMVTILVALMAVVTSLEAGFAEALFPGELDMQALMQVNAGLLALWLAMAGLCFLSACLFSNATAALWVGGGLNILFFLMLC